MTSDNKNEMDDRLKRIVELTEQKIKERIESEIGFTDDLNLMQLLEDRSIKSKIKQCLCDVVIPQFNPNDCIKEIEKIASCSKLYNRDLYWSIKDLVFNIHMRYNNAYNTKLANEFGMEYFIYMGGLMDDSRDFCRDHDGHVYHKDDAKEWSTWTPAKAVNITEFKQKDLNAVPSYLGFPGYDPLIDLGGYNCRHHLAYISYELAKEMRGET